MAARWAWPAADGGRLAQQTRLAGQAIKPGQGDEKVTAHSSSRVAACDKRGCFESNPSIHDEVLFPTFRRVFLMWTCAV